MIVIIKGSCSLSCRPNLQTTEAVAVIPKTNIASAIAPKIIANVDIYNCFKVYKIKVSSNKVVP